MGVRRRWRPGNVQSLEDFRMLVMPMSGRSSDGSAGKGREVAVYHTETAIAETTMPAMR